MFALVDMPETVKGALFARYSRYQGTLRRLFLDEFAGDVATSGAGRGAGEGERAAKLYERIFLGYGDDSVAQLGGAHIACEWVSNVLTKILQRPRLGAYLEQSTRYIAYDAPMPDPPGGYRYYYDSHLGLRYAQAMDELFSIYSQALPRVVAWAAEEFPREADEAPAAHERAIKAKALDLLRGLLPASSLSHMGIFASGQTYEQLILHLLAHPLPEARSYGQMILDEVKAVMPSFVTRVERPDRGGEWIGYLESRAAAGERWAQRLGLREGGSDADHGPSVALTQVHGDEDDLLAALLFESTTVSEDAARDAVSRLDSDERAELLGDLVGERANRRHRPGARLRGRPLPLRDRVGLRRLPRPPAPSDADAPVADADARSGGRRARAGGARRMRRRLPPRARGLAPRIRPAGGRRPGHGGTVRAVPRLPDPLRPGPQRARGHAADRAALRP